MAGFRIVHESALILEVPEAHSAVDRWRRHHDPIASHGIPPHITALYPFVAPESLTEADAVRVREVLRGVQPWSFRLTAVDEFPRVVWLRPEPAAPFREVTLRLWEAFPDFPPFGGRHDDLVPHLTIAHVAEDEDQSALVTRIRSDLRHALPIECRATGLALFVSDRHRTWHCTHRFPFEGEHD